MSDNTPKQVASPGSDVSPRSQPTAKSDYFSLTRKQKSVAAADDKAKRTICVPHAQTKHPATFDAGSQGKETDNTGDASATTPGETASSSGSSAPNSRKGSLGNVTFRPPQNPLLPQGNKKPHGGSRIRHASPPHRRLLKTERVCAQSDPTRAVVLGFASARIAVEA
ncbi:hypothetical protein F4859DRAFT_68895 [Xylaria cf. heliscus]|nr:hypothetical protein F4859DRAFT_68895 [Xylaria cf. heliscus]